MADSQFTCNCDVIHEDIVNDVKKKMQSKEEYIELASLFKLFGDGTRVQILHALEQSEMCVCDLAQILNMTQSAISHQLRVLKQMDLVKSRREGKTIFYSLADGHITTILSQGLDHIQEDEVR